jgi:fibronectin type 3 domain-containing protein
MASGSINWSPRVVVDASASTSDPPDVAGAVDSSGKVHVFWVTSASGGSLKYTTLVSPYTSPSATVTIAVSGSQPRYPHVPAQVPLSGGYVPLVYQSGTGSPYSIVLDTTLAGSTSDTTPPSVPTGLAATVKSGTEIDLSWTASADDVAVTGYDVYRNGGKIGQVGGSTMTYADIAAAQGVSYTYAVDAFDAAGNHSAQSAFASATIPDTTPPTVPAGVSATTLSCAPKACFPLPPGHINTSWNASTDDVAVTGYTVYRDGTQIAAVPASTLWYEDTGRSQFTTYSYTVDAFDAAGNHSAQSTAASITTPDWTPPTAPAGLMATVVSNGEIDLSWTASTDNVGVAGYTVYRNGIAWTTTTGLAFADTGLGHGVTYTYTVDAFDAAGNHSAQSTAASATTPQQFVQSLGGVLTSGPSAASWASDHTYVFVRGTDNGLWYKTWSGTSWGNWTPLGGVLSSDPSVVSWGANRIDVFVRGSDNQLWHRWYENGVWYLWEPLGGVLTSAPGASSWGPNHLDIFVRGTDNALWQKTWNGSTWSNWQPLGGILTSNPSAVSSTANQIDVFVRGTDNGLWQKTWNGSSWGNWQPHGGVLTSAPAAASCTAGHLDVFVIGTDGGMWHLGYNGSTWSLWQPLGGVWTANPAGVCPPGTSFVLAFGRGTDNQLWQTSTPGS